MKRDLYSMFMSRMKGATESGQFFEASWYAYAVLEDRLRSLLRNSGGEGENNGIGKPIRMMGPKLRELKKRAKKDELLQANFEYNRLNTWKDDRNNLMHAMADATMTLEQIDVLAKALAQESEALVREYSSAAQRLKKHRDKVTV